MPNICFYFQVHQPRRIKKYPIFNIGKDHDYFNDDSESKLNNRKIFKKVSEKCYLPANKVMLDLLTKHKDFKISYSLSGIFLEQAEEYYPEVLNSFRSLVETGQVELLSETYYHSLASLYSQEEFKSQIEMHKDVIKRLFNVEPRVFRNTELVYNNDIAKIAEDMGFLGILTEGVDDVLGWRSPNFLYKPKGTEKIKLLLKNYKLSDDIAFRFSSRDWKEWPLTADKFASWVSEHNGNGEIINLFMDYETFGEHQWEDTGIFHFLYNLPDEVFKNKDNGFKTPSEVITTHRVHDEIDIKRHISWADVERDLSAWRSNSMQHTALDGVYSIKEAVFKTKNKDLISDWRKLQTSDHFYYMCTKWFSDGDVHKYFNPYESPYDAFISYMNVLKDLKTRIKEA
jgi:alpha-amylase